MDLVTILVFLIFILYMHMCYHLCYMLSFNLSGKDPLSQLIKVLRAILKDKSVSIYIHVCNI